MPAPNVAAYGQQQPPLDCFENLGPVALGMPLTEGLPVGMCDTSATYTVKIQSHSPGSPGPAAMHGRASQGQGQPPYGAQRAPGVAPVTGSAPGPIGSTRTSPYPDGDLSGVS